MAHSYLIRKVFIDRIAVGGRSSPLSEFSHGLLRWNDGAANDALVLLIGFFQTSNGIMIEELVHLN